MNKRKYNIGFFTSDYNRGLVSVVMNSLMEYTQQYENLNVRVFDCFGVALENGGRSPATMIYSLPDLNDYDGVIVQSHQIVSESALARLAEGIRETKIPAVSIGDFMEGCTQINTDDYSAFRDITEHLITEHGARSFLFIKGVERKRKGEAEARRHGFEDVCREHGIRPDDISYAEGSWLNRAGKKAVTEYLKSGRPLPDAIVAANDEMALGAMSALAKAGISVPDDILVSGYDDTLGASLSTPRLMTVRRDFKTMVFTAMDTLRRVIKDHEELPEIIYSPYRLLTGGTCGCPGRADLELVSLKKSFYEKNRELMRFYTRQEKISSELFRAETPSGLFDVMENNSSVFGDGSLFICLNDFYHDSLYLGDSAGLADPRVSRRFSDRLLLTACTKNMEKMSDGAHIYYRFARSGLKDVPFWKDERFLIFFPLRFKNILMGFLVLTKPPTSSALSMYEVVLRLFEFAMENVRQKRIGQKLNERLDILYITDPLSGLYNRFAYERYAEGLLREIREKDAMLRVLFIDIDNMKSINDQYGHDGGDQAIITVSDAIKRSCRKDDFKMRYGGDEFVIITEGAAGDLKTRIRDAINVINGTNGLPFKVNVSIGEYFGDTGPYDSPDSFLEYADKQMYREKEIKKNRIES